MGLGWSLTDAFAFSLPSPLDTMHALHGRIPASIARLPLRLRSPRAATPIVLLFLFTIILSRYPSRQDTFVRVPRESVPTTKPLSERLSTQSTFSLLSSYFDSPEYDDLEWGDNDGDYSLYAAKIAKNQRPYAQQAAAISEPASARSGRLGTAATAPKSGKKKYNNRPDPYSYRPDGLMEASSVGPHPVYELIKTSNKQWKRKLKDASKTLEEAVTEYRRRYNRLPPKGFEKWWDYVIKHDVQLPDEYDQIYHDLEPFWGMKPAYVIEQQKIWEEDQEVGSYTIVNEDQFVYMSGHTMKAGEEEVATTRAEQQIALLKEVQQWLPPFRATFTAHDVPYQFIGHDMKSEAFEHAALSEYLDTGIGFQTQRRGWRFACPETSPLRSHNPHAGPPTTEGRKEPKSFIWDHKLAMDPCQHVSHVHLNGFLSSHGEGPVPRKKMVPAFSMCTTQLHSDILTVAMEMWTEDVGDDPPWAEKKHNKLLWRGRNTGIYFGEDGRWNQSQRVRLVRQANEDLGFVDVLKPTANWDEPVGPPKSQSRSVLNEQLMDIGFSGEAIQCAPAVCDEVESTFRYKRAQSFEAANDFKYIIDIDGNGWSARFKRLMTSTSLIFKSTIFPEWYTDRIQPWVHYVPIKHDYTDLYDVFSFFHGDTEGNDGHDYLAERIAAQGRDWSLKFWRKEDMVAYMFRLFLEYSRVMSLDREAATFRWEDVRP